MITIIVLNAIINEASDGEWQQVYEIKDTEENDLKGKFYIVYGGGPEGGYFVSGNRLYNIDRTWAQPWRRERISGMRLIVNAGGDSVNIVSDDGQVLIINTVSVTLTTILCMVMVVMGIISLIKKAAGSSTDKRKLKFGAKGKADKLGIFGKASPTYS